jgi:hypothetical protein
MILTVDDDTAAEAITEAARKYPEMNNDEIYEFVRVYEQVPVSRRQVATTMRKLKRELKEAFKDVPFREQKG